ncbi:MAG: hypothetical protein HY934_05750 [Candidatus Firestonebacteria bacterium]|nr:hypothetical protein [Candidatus Firestonebacteria bacterium]
MNYVRKILTAYIWFNLIICKSIFGFDNGMNSGESRNYQNIVWEAEVSDNNLKVVKNKFSSPSSIESFPFKFIGKQNYEGFFKNNIFFIESHGYQTSTLDLKNKLAEFSHDGSYFLGHTENKDLKDHFRFVYSKALKNEIIWDQYKIKKDIDNVYIAPDGTYIVFTHGNSEEMVSYIQFINDKGDIYSTYNFPAQNLKISPLGNYLVAYNKKKFQVLGKSGTKIYDEEVDSEISKYVVINNKGTCVITTKESPYILNVYSISGSKRLKLEKEEQIRGVDLTDDDNFLVYFQELFIANTLKYVMKLVDLKTGKEVWDRALPQYTEEFPEIYMGKDYIIVYFLGEKNSGDKHLIYLYDYKGNLVKNYSYPEKPILSEDKKYLLIFGSPKLYLYQIDRWGVDEG